MKRLCVCVCVCKWSVCGCVWVSGLDSVLLVTICSPVRIENLSDLC